MLHVAAARDREHIAVAGRRGFVIYSNVDRK
jgi:hypothetical protein